MKRFYAVSCMAWNNRFSTISITHAAMTIVSDSKEEAVTACLLDYKSQFFVAEGWLHDVAATLVGEVHEGSVEIRKGASDG